MTNTAHAHIDESEAAVDAHNAHLLVNEIEDGLQRLREMAYYVHGLVDDLAVYLPKDPT